MRIGIDLGGTKTEGILLAPDGAILRRVRKPTPRDDYDGTLTTIREIVAELEAGLDRRPSVGIGIPGAVSPATGLVKKHAAEQEVLVEQALEWSFQSLPRPFSRPTELSKNI